MKFSGIHKEAIVKKTFGFGGLIAALLVLTCSALGRTLRVPQDHQTIQSAVNQADAGDSIVVSPGDYNYFNANNKENLTIIGAGMEAEARSRVHGPGGNQVAVYFGNCNGFEFSGFEVSDGYTAIWLHESQDGWIHHNYVHDTHAGWASSISIDGGGGHLIERNLMLSAEHYGMYIVWGAENIIVRNNTVGATIHNDGIHFDGARNISVYNNIIFYSEDYGIFFNNGNDNIDVRYNVLWNNEQRCNNGLDNSNIDANPLFVNLQNSDFHITENSPCRDAGDPDSPRDPDGTRADIGCFYYPIPAHFTLSVDTLRFEPLCPGERLSLPFEMTYDDGFLNEILIQLRPAEDDDLYRISPAEATLEQGDVMEFDLIVQPGEEHELGFVTGGIEIFLEEGDVPFMTIPVEGYIVEGFGRIFGVAIDAQTELPVPGTTIRFDGFPNRAYQAVADDNGIIDLTHVPCWRYLADVTHPDYLPAFSDSIILMPDEEVELDIVLRYAAAICETDEIMLSQEPDTEVTHRLSLRNPGSARLNYQITRVFPDGDDREFELIETFDVERQLGDTRIQGLEIVDDNLFVCGGNSGQGTGKIYHLDRNFELVNVFDNFVQSAYGLRDLTWDGELLWGNDQNVIYGFTIEGDLVATFNAPVNPSRNVVWDSERECFWVCDVTSDIFALDREGNIIQRIARPGVRAYGMACRPDDPDGTRLYIFANDPGHNAGLYKFNPDNRNLTFLADLPIGAAVAGAASISDLWNPQSLQFVGLLRNGIEGDGFDQIGFFHLSARQDWLSVSPREGSIRPEGLDFFEVTFNSVGFPNCWLHAELEIAHNGRGGALQIPISLFIRPDGEPAAQNITIGRGLSLVSLALDPFNPDIPTIFRPLVQAGGLEFVKDGAGRFYTPGINGFCNIPGWNPAEGYLVRSRDPIVLRVSGNALREDEPIPLHSGWQMVAYYPESPNSPAAALANIAGDLLLVKDVSGAFYSPRWDFSNLGLLRRGSGYKMLLANATHLIWRGGDPRLVPENFPKTDHFVANFITGGDMSLLLLAETSVNGEVGVFANDRLVGSGVMMNGKCGLAVRGEVKSGDGGAAEGEKLTFVFWNGSGEAVVEAAMLEGEAIYRSDAFAVAELKIADEQTLPEEFAITAVYPNPFNGRTSVAFSLPEAGLVRVGIYDSEGRLVADLANQVFSAGRHSLEIDFSSQVSGVYFLKIEANGLEQTRKLILMK